MYFYMLQKSIFHIKINDTSFPNIGLYCPAVDTFHKHGMFMVWHGLNGRAHNHASTT